MCVVCAMWDSCAHTWFACGMSEDVCVVYTLWCTYGTCAVGWCMCSVCREEGACSMCVLCVLWVVCIVHGVMNHVGCMCYVSCAMSVSAVSCASNVWYMLCVVFMELLHVCVTCIMCGM